MLLHITSLLQDSGLLLIFLSKECKVETYKIFQNVCVLFIIHL